VRGWFAGGVKIRGAAGNRALVIGFAASVMTLSKTVLYCEYMPLWGDSWRMLIITDFNEYFSGFASVKHNDWFTIFLFYGVMK
jgi:hypothetical protein